MVQPRLIGLDYLRVFLVLLGIPFHTVLFLAWRLSDFTLALPSLAQLTATLPYPAASLLVGFFSFYLYWMPVFFLLAGFFAHFAYQQRGMKAFALNRLRRIGGPLLFCTLWLVLFGWLIDGLSCYFSSLAKVATLLHEAYRQEGGLLGLLNHLGSVWFLYDLVIFYGLTLALLSLQRCFSLLQRGWQFFDHSLTRLFIKQWHYGLFALLGVFLMAKSVWLGYTPLDASVKPDGCLLIFYGVWYAMGWWLWKHQGQFKRFFKHSWKMFFIAMLLYSAFLGCYYAAANTEQRYVKGIGLVLDQLALSVSVFALFGIAWHSTMLQHTVVRYLSGASYWLYLTQIAFITAFMALTTPSAAQFYQQSLQISVATLCLSLLSYQFIVRSTWLNRVVGG